jgi:hypothetical protein
MSLVRGFEKGEINIARLKYAMIEANTLKKFRLNSLINCSFKIFIKALSTRLESICNRLLTPNQTVFCQRQIYFRKCCFST